MTEEIEKLQSKISSLEEENKTIIDKCRDSIGEKQEEVNALAAENKELKEENGIAEIDIKKWMVWHDELEAKVEELESKLSKAVGWMESVLKINPALKSPIQDFTLKQDIRELLNQLKEGKV